MTSTARSVLPVVVDGTAVICPCRSVIGRGAMSLAILCAAGERVLVVVDVA